MFRKKLEKQLEFDFRVKEKRDNLRATIVYGSIIAMNCMSFSFLFTAGNPTVYETVKTMVGAYFSG